MKTKILYSTLCLLLAFGSHSLAATTSKGVSTEPSSLDSIDHRLTYEKKQINNPFLISLYKPTFLLPANFTFTPYRSIYEDRTPDQQRLMNTEVAFQLSFKVPVWHNILGRPSTLYVAYTQQSFWQAYNKSPFFRETNYEPEFFIANQVNWPLLGDWKVKLINLGVVHQSNGRGGELERSWNRAYVDATFASNNWMISIKPWYIFNDSSIKLHNQNIDKFLGHGRLVAAYKYGQQTFSIESRNNFESGFKRGAVKLAWSFPMIGKINGYVQGFSGYGQSLIEYNHYTNSVGIGIALNDWI